MSVLNRSSGAGLLIVLGDWPSSTATDSEHARTRTSLFISDPLFNRAKMSTVPTERSTLQGVRRRIERHGLLLEVRLVRHVTRDRRVMAEHHVLYHRLPRFHRLEEPPQVRPGVIVRIALIADAVGERFLARLGIVFGVPLVEVLVAERRREARRVVTRSGVDACLRRKGQAGLAQFEDALRAKETQHFWR